MKKLLSVVIAAFCICSSAIVISAIAASTAKPTDATPDPIVRELADTKAALATAQNAQQSSAIAAEYYKAISEKNEALLRLMQVQAQVADLTKQLAEARAEVETMKVPKPEAKK